MRILVVDDDQDSRQYLARFLHRMGHEIVEKEDGKAALLELQTSPAYPLILSDIYMPGLNGFDLLEHVKQDLYPQPAVVLFTGEGDLETGRRALRAGAYDYLLKPVDLGELEVIIEHAAEYQSLRTENESLNKRFDDELSAATVEVKRELQQLRKHLAAKMGLDALLFVSPQMRCVLEQSRIFHEDPNIPVLIEGETGVGKEIIAQLIHYGEDAFNKPLIDINCAAISSGLFESELFGYEGGSFTGASAKGQKGKIDAASGGTLFLDEIGDMPVELQAKLLRLLEEKQYYKVGGLKKMKMDARVICATNVNLSDKVEEGAFRRDLFYRLQVGHIRIPPLRERKEDIIPLANMFMEKFSREKCKSFQVIAADTKKIFLKRAWPGNVRELRNEIELATLMHDDHELRPEHLRNSGGINEEYQPVASSTAAQMRNNSENCFKIGGCSICLPTGGCNLENIIDGIILNALSMNGNIKSATARYLGISRRSLCYRLDKIKNAKMPE